MNLLILDENPELAAAALSDRSLQRLPLVTVRMLATAAARVGLLPPLRPFTESEESDHPCILWLAHSQGNFLWGMRYAEGMTAEYERRFKRPYHDGQMRVLEWIANNDIWQSFPSKDRTPFLQCLPPEFQNPDPVAAYRKWYVFDARRGKEAWTSPGVRPAWWDESTVTHTLAHLQE